MQVNTIGLDIAKSVFQVHGVDGTTGEVFVKRLRRGQLLEYFAGLEPSLIGIEACSGAHHWARELENLGHAAKLLPPSYVKPYVKRGKSDALDAEAICEALLRPSMRFVPVKSKERQAVLVLHKVREQLVRERTKLVNVLRAHLSEFGIVAPQGISRIRDLMAVIADGRDTRLPDMAREALKIVVRQLDRLKADIAALERKIVKHGRGEEAVKRLAAVPGIGPITASALAASVADANIFKSGRRFAAYLGLTPKQNASGLKSKKGRISKMGNSYLRTLLVLGATSMVHRAEKNPAPMLGLVRRLSAKGKPVRLITVALANKMARIVWALLARGETYRSLPAHQGDAHPHLAAALAHA